MDPPKVESLRDDLSGIASNLKEKLISLEAIVLCAELSNVEVQTLCEIRELCADTSKFLISHVKKTSKFAL